MTQRIFYYYPKTERLFIEWEEGGKLIKEEKVPVSRDDWKNPYFSIEKEEVSHWIQFGIWTREKGNPQQHKVIRGFYKEISYSETRQIITYYCKELKLETEEKGKLVKEVYIFTFDFIDIALYNNKKEWAWKNKEGQPKLPD